MKLRRLKKPHALRLSRELRRIEHMCLKKEHSYGALMKILSLRSHALPALIFAIPFLTPLPLPGFSLAGGTMIAIVGFRGALGLDPWLPKRVRKKKIPQKIMQGIFRFLEWLASKIEFLIKPRAKFIFRFRGTNRAVGAMIGFCGFLIALPFLPPGTSVPCASTIVLLSLGVLEQDGVFVLLGYFSFFMNLLFHAAIFWASIEALIRL